MVGQGSGDQPSGNLAADRVFLGLRTTDPTARTGIVQLYVKDGGAGQMTLFATSPLELGGTSQEIAGLSQAEIELLIEADTQGITNTWRYSVISESDIPPGFPSVDDRVLVGSAPTGAFAGNAGDIAVWGGTAWKFQISQPGYRVWDEAAGVWKITSDGSTWTTEGGVVDLWTKVGALLEPTTNGDGLLNIPQIEGFVNSLRILGFDSTGLPGPGTATLQGRLVTVAQDNTLLSIDDNSIVEILGAAQGGEFRLERNHPTTPVVFLRITEGTGKVRITSGLKVGGDSEPDASAIAEITGTGGFLVPRLTTAQRGTIVGPATSLLIFNTDTNEFEFYDGTAWGPLGGGVIINRNIKSPPAISGTTNDWNPTGLGTATIIRISTTGAIPRLTGIVAQESGRQITLINVTGTTLSLRDQDSGSVAANRFLLTANLSLQDNESAIIFYDSVDSRWRVSAASI